jgi:hypothetical protein
LIAILHTKHAGRTDCAARGKGTLSEGEFAGFAATVGFDLAKTGPAVITLTPMDPSFAV